MRSKIYIFILLLCLSLNSFAQFTLRIEITATPAAHKEEGVFAAGTFNSWQPGDSNYLFKKENNLLVLQIKNLAAKNYQFKFTRHIWQKVESTSAGNDVENKIINLFTDTVIQYKIDGWKDDFATIKKHTASLNVHILDTAFFIPQLNTHRRIQLYLPPGYKTSNKQYPVLYMHDGQNLFDEATTAFGEEWGVDECLDSLIKKGKPACIVVGIDNGAATRMNEYNPYEFIYEDSTTSKTFAPQGNQYLSFIKQTLKPFIDKKYRTLSDKENTIIAGSSMGGLISYYAVLKYPDVFGKAGVFSPAFWAAPAIKTLTDSVTKKLDNKFFFYMGEKEGRTYIYDMKEVAEKLGTNSNVMIYSVIDTQGKHNEKAWRKWFAEFYNWMMADGYNNVIKLEE
jgi:predicted alpha/beta superfamily hydrolase